MLLIIYIFVKMSDFENFHLENGQYPMCLLVCFISHTSSLKPIYTQKIGSSSQIFHTAMTINFLGITPLLFIAPCKKSMHHHIF